MRTIGPAQYPGSQSPSEISKLRLQNKEKTNKNYLKIDRDQFRENIRPWNKKYSAITRPNCERIFVWKTFRHLFRAPMEMKVYVRWEEVLKIWGIIALLMSPSSVLRWQHIHFQLFLPKNRGNMPSLTHIYMWNETLVVVRVWSRFCASTEHQNTLLRLTIYVFECFLLRLPKCDSSKGALLRQDARARVEYSIWSGLLLSLSIFEHAPMNSRRRRSAHGIVGGMRTTPSCLQRLHGVPMSPCAMIYSMGTNVSCNFICTETDEDWRLNGNWFHRVRFDVYWREYLHQLLDLQDCLLSVCLTWWLRGLTYTE